MYSCMYGQAPQYLMDCCPPTSSVASRQQLRSASQRLLVVARCQLSVTARRAFAVVGPSVWNNLCRTTCAISVLAEIHLDNIWKRFLCPLTAPLRSAPPDFRLAPLRFSLRSHALPVFTTMNCTGFRLIKFVYFFLFKYFYIYYNSVSFFCGQ